MHHLLCVSAVPFSQKPNMESRELLIACSVGGVLLVLALLQLLKERIPRISVTVEQGTQHRAPQRECQI